MALLDAGFGGGWDKKFSGTKTACPVRFVPPDSFLKRLTKESRIVELDEGPRMMTNIVGVETAPIGTRVKARIVEIDGEAAVVFGLIDGGRT